MNTADLEPAEAASILVLASQKRLSSDTYEHTFIIAMHVVLKYAAEHGYGKATELMVDGCREVLKRDEMLARLPLRRMT